MIEHWRVSLATKSKYMGVEYILEKGFNADTHPALAHGPTKIKELEAIASDLEWQGKSSESIRKQIDNIKQHIDNSSSEYYPLH